MHGTSASTVPARRQQFLWVQVRIGTRVCVTIGKTTVDGIVTDRVSINPDNKFNLYKVRMEWGRVAGRNRRNFMAEPQRSELDKAIDRRLFQFIKENVRIGVSDYGETDYGCSYTVVEVTLYITDPDTDKEEQINSQTVRIEDR